MAGWQPGAGETALYVRALYDLDLDEDYYDRVRSLAWSYRPLGWPADYQLSPLQERLGFRGSITYKFEQQLSKQSRESSGEWPRRLCEHCVCLCVCMCVPSLHICAVVATARSSRT